MRRGEVNTNLWHFETGRSWAYERSTREGKPRCPCGAMTPVRAVGRKHKMRMETYLAKCSAKVSHWSTNPLTHVPPQELHAIEGDDLRRHFDVAPKARCCAQVA
jgi:hypothetical protein